MRNLPSLPLLVATALAAEPKELKSWQLSLDGDIRGGFVAEAWGSSQVSYLEERDSQGVYEGVKVKGNNRLFAISDYVWAHKWRDVSYRHFNLLDRALSFTIDVSNVGCGCNAAVYLVQMTEPDGDGPGYCDIQGYDSEFDIVQPCLEIDLLEGNAKAVQATLHTGRGKGADGQSCNQDGCVCVLSGLAVLGGPIRLAHARVRACVASSTVTQTRLAVLLPVAC